MTDRHNTLRKRLLFDAALVIPGLGLLFVALILSVIAPDCPRGVLVGLALSGVGLIIADIACVLRGFPKP